MEEHNLMHKEKLPLGFTFSFPCKQEGLTCAKLVGWTKGTGVVNYVSVFYVTCISVQASRPPEWKVVTLSSCSEKPVHAEG